MQDPDDWGISMSIRMSNTFQENVQKCTVFSYLFCFVQSSDGRTAQGRHNNGHHGIEIPQL